MKNRILALLLAGLLTASMASCVATGSSDTPGGDTEDSQTLETTTNGDGPITPIVQWTPKEQAVYTTDTVKFRKEPSSTGETLTNIPAKTEVQAKRVSSDGWYEVVYQEVTGYVSARYVTDVDILGNSFTPVEGGKKTMYVNTDSLSIRLYPSTDSFSKIMDHYKLNDEVTVVATNEKWSKIEYSAGVYYFVNSTYLSETKSVDVNDESLYTDKFTACETPLTKYTKGQVNLRKVPHLKGEIITTLENAEVKVLKTGTVEDINWCYVVVQIPGVLGEKKGYVSASYLADNSSTGSVTLDDVLASYTGFTKLATAMDMYVLATTDSLFARTTPDFEDDDNIASTLTSKQKVKVVATGKYDGVNCCIIEVTTKDNKVNYYFVGSSHLTTNAQGLPTVTLDDLTVKYPDFTLCEKVTVTANTDVNCFTVPDGGKTPAHKLKTGDRVTLVAMQTGGYFNNVWAIQIEAGDIFFVDKNLFTK